MKTLEESNRIIMEGRKDPPNDIKCPKCEENGNISELRDNTHSPIILTYPPQIEVYCIQCNWRGWRYI